MRIRLETKNAAEFHLKNHTMRIEPLSKGVDQ